MNIKKATLLGMLLAFGLSICSAFAVSVHDNGVGFVADQGMTVSFEWNGSYCITANQPWGDSDHPDAVYINNNALGTAIDIYCGRHDSSPVGDYFNSVSLNNTWGSSISSMNFAIQGTLTINSDKYFVVVGQLSCSSGNVWAIAGQDFMSYAQNDTIVITPDGKYTINSPVGSSNAFTVYAQSN